MPPPNNLRARRARAMVAASPASTEPTGAPSPFERHTLTVWHGAAISAMGTPLATCAFQMRAPSMWSFRPCLSQKARTALMPSSG